MTKDDVIEIVSAALGDLASMSDDQSGTRVDYTRGAEVAVEALMAAGVLLIDGSVGEGTPQ